MCPSLELVEQDPAEAGQAWEGIVRRLEDEGIAVEPAGIGCLYFDTRGVERLYGGVAGAAERALAALGPRGTRARGPPSASSRRLPPRASHGRARGSSSKASGRRISSHRCRSRSCRSTRRGAELEGLGMKTVGQLAGFPAPPSRSAWDRTDGERGAWRGEEGASRQAPPPSGRDRRTARVRRGGRQRTHAPPRARRARRDAGPAGARRTARCASSRSRRGWSAAAPGAGR